ncbi:MAG: helix-turn-helix domain-containing protein [Paludibacter sp.]|jgi:AraC-like DNA-binding protein/tetratricopeptide (TPR) repeat protein|nr:helix-turn-helix domain-containing protein [Paludibacter sp.]
MCKQRIILTNLLSLAALFSGFAQTSIIPDSILYRKYDERKLSLQSEPKTEGCDSVYFGYWHKWLYYNSDTIFNLMATRPLTEIYERVWYYYSILSIDHNRITTEREKFAAYAKQHKNKNIEIELDIFDANYYWNASQNMTPEIWNVLMKLVDKYERRGDLQTKCRLLHIMLDKCNLTDGYFTHRIQQGRVPVIWLMKEIESTVDQMNGTYVETAYLYFMLANIYYFYKFYDKAVPLYRKAVKYPSRYGYLSACDYLATHYTKTGDYERSDSLYFVILQHSRRYVEAHINDIVAIGAIAYNAWQRGQNDEAMRLYSIILPRALQAGDSTLAGGYALHLGRLYMEKNELDKTAELFAAARKYLFLDNRLFRNQERYYTLGRDYYLKINRADKAAVYIDSLADIQKKSEDIFSSKILAYAEQEAFEMEKAIKNKQIEVIKIRIVWISLMFGLATISLLIILYHYRKKQRAYRALFQQIKEQDRLSEDLEQMRIDKLQSAAEQPCIETNSASLQLVMRLREYLLQDEIFAKADIDLDIIPNLLSTNRTYLYKAVKLVTGKTLQEYINLLRMETAKRKLETDFSLPIETIAQQCGFNSRTTFYRFFVAQYNLSPTAYRKMAELNTTL